MGDIVGCMSQVILPSEVGWWEAFLSIRRCVIGHIPASFSLPFWLLFIPP